MHVCKGYAVLTSKPFAFILSSKNKDNHCDQCFRKGKLLKCSGCQYVSYCDRSCQKEAWSIHKSECSNLKQILPRIIPDAARLMARIVIKLKKGGGEEKEYYDKNCFRKFKDLMSHYSDLKNDSKRMEHFISLCGVLYDYMGRSQLPNSAELLGIYGRICINSFNILDLDMNTIGTGVYLGPSIIDHSCKPNAVAVFEGTTIIIRTLEDIPNFNIFNIRISYVDVLNDKSSRCKELKNTYYFDCECEKCQSPEPYVRAGLCPSCYNAVDINKGVCLECDRKSTVDYIELFKETEEYTRHYLDSMSSVAYLDICQKILSKQENVFYPLNIQRIRTIESAFEAAINLEKWINAEIFGLEIISGYRFYYGEMNPLTGLLYLMISKIQLHLSKSRLALENLKKAQEVLSVTHGEKHSLFCDNILPLLYQATMESQ